MDINSVFKLGSSVDILLRTYTGQQIGKDFYQQNQPYTVLKDVTINFFSSQEGAKGEADGRWLSYNDSEPTTIVLRNVPLTDKVIDLIFDKSKTTTKSHYFSAKASQNTLFMQHDAAKNVYIYEADTNQFIGYSEQVEDRFITDKKLIDGKLYYVFYEYESQDIKKCFNLVSPATAYFTLDIFGQGNTDDTSSNVFLKVKKCALRTNNSLNFNEGLNTVNLTFDIIKDDRLKENNYMIIE